MRNDPNGMWEKRGGVQQTGKSKVDSQAKMKVG